MLFFGFVLILNSGSCILDSNTHFTLMLQKPRMLQIRDGKGEVVLRYFEPLPIPPKAGRHHTAFPKGKN